MGCQDLREEIAADQSRFAQDPELLNHKTSLSRKLSHCNPLPVRMSFFAQHSHVDHAGLKHLGWSLGRNRARNCE
jgi:hypothetical protein